jgi:NAD(P)H dehydrogenase (quinone)
MIVVTGANGAYGRLVAQHLLTRLPAGELAVSVRDPAAAGDLAARGVRVRHGDFGRPDTLPDAFAGATTVLINGTYYGTPPATRGVQMAAAIRAAVATGATRLVVTSWQDLDNCPPESSSDFPATERLVAGSTSGWTILRLMYGLPAALARDVRSAQRDGVLTAPAGDARTTPAAVPDLAEATANVLAEPGHERTTYELTGPDAVSWADLAALAGRLAGRDIPYRPGSEAEFRAATLAAAFPPQAIDSLLDLYRAFRAGWTATPTTHLVNLLRHPATPALDAVAGTIPR